VAKAFGDGKPGKTTITFKELESNALHNRYRQVPLGICQTHEIKALLLVGSIFIFIFIRGFWLLPSIIFWRNRYATSGKHCSIDKNTPTASLHFGTPGMTLISNETLRFPCSIALQRQLQCVRCGA
jgi:hypothetical protein